MFGWIIALESTRWTTTRGLSNLAISIYINYTVVVQYLNAYIKTTIKDQFLQSLSIYLSNLHTRLTQTIYLSTSYTYHCSVQFTNRRSSLVSILRYKITHYTVWTQPKLYPHKTEPKPKRPKQEREPNQRESPCGSSYLYLLGWMKPKAYGLAFARGSGYCCWAVQQFQ